MSLAVTGLGWVTPLGSEVAAVCERVRNGEIPAAEAVSGAANTRTYHAYRVPPAACAHAPAHPRLRRASAISRFAAAAGFSALHDAGLKLDGAAAERTALIFAISNGGVIYTKRFYHEVIESGAQAASPLLFPETVFNAPASHLAAMLGIAGASYTLVGDGAVGILALKMAEDLMINPAIDRCLVVGAEEADWLLCDAYRRWRLLRDEPPMVAFQEPPRGTILSEGAGAVVIERSAAAAENRQVPIERIDAGCNFHRQTEAASCVNTVFAGLEAPTTDLVVASANGTFVDAAEDAAIRRHCPEARVATPKVSLGESVGASVLWQVIYAAQALRDGFATAALVSACGLNQQVAGLRLARRD